jgi:hypothetical protein
MFRLLLFSRDLKPVPELSRRHDLLQHHGLQSAHRLSCSDSKDRRTSVFRDPCLTRSTHVGTHVESNCLARYPLLLPAGEKVAEGRMRGRRALHQPSPARLRRATSPKFRRGCFASRLNTYRGYPRAYRTADYSRHALIRSFTRTQQASVARRSSAPACARSGDSGTLSCVHSIDRCAVNEPFGELAP